MFDHHSHQLVKWSHLITVIQSPNSFQKTFVCHHQTHTRKSLHSSVSAEWTDVLGSNSSAFPRGEVAFQTPCFFLWHRGVFKSLWPAFSYNVIVVVLKLQKEKDNLMETWVWFWRRRMSTAARLVEVCQFAWNNSYPGKPVLLLLLCTIFSSFLSPRDFFNLYSCFFFKKKFKGSFYPLFS